MPKRISSETPRVPTAKRDPSFLEWHYKKPTKEELQDKYDCFTYDEWLFQYQASKESTTLSSRKKNDPAIMNAEAKRLACEDCDLSYQLSQRREGNCKPIQWDLTPLGRAGVPDE